MFITLIVHFVHVIIFLPTPAPTPYEEQENADDAKTERAVLKE